MSDPQTSEPWISNGSTPHTRRPRRTPLRHHGVQLLAPGSASGNHARTWTIKWRDPLTRRWRTQRLPGLVNTTTDADKARAAAVRKAAELDAAKRGLLVSGPAAVVTVQAECARYLTESALEAKKGVNRGQPLDANTVARYRRQLAIFTGWCTRVGCHVLGDLTQAKLADYRSYTRLAKHADGAVRTASTVNLCLKPVRQMLIDAKHGGRLDTLDSDAVRQALRAFPQSTPAPVCWSVPQLQAYLRAARHLDRSHAVPALAPALCLALLGGLRLGEIYGCRVGDYRPREPTDYDPSRTHPVLLVDGKTGARTVELLPYSPLLVALLDAMTAGRAADEPLQGLSYDQIDRWCLKLKLQIKSLRSTCASYQGPLLGDPKSKAARLGHTMSVCEVYYMALSKGTPKTQPAPDPTTPGAPWPSLETIMQVSDEVRAVIAAVNARRTKPRAERCPPARKRGKK